MTPLDDATARHAQLCARLGSVLPYELMTVQAWANAVAEYGAGSAQAELAREHFERARARRAALAAELDAASVELAEAMATSHREARQ
ncbi:hypothetical protein ACLEPN_30570 [Myxococcus sp. 1LA]